MSAATDNVATESRSQSLSLFLSEVASSAAAAALRVTPIRRAVMAAGRAKIMRDAENLGIPWQREVEELRRSIPDTLDRLRLKLEDPNLADPQNLPRYYLAEFHAYRQGNLGWEPALEAEVSSRAVHSRQNSEQPLHGDHTLRWNAIEILADRWNSEVAEFPPHPQAILDIGCSVGLSTDALLQRFPDAKVVGVDASSYMLAVGASKRPQVEFVHGIAEDLPRNYANKFDVVSISLMLHEVPDDSLSPILSESYRVLRPGGMLFIMDSDPSCFNNTPPVILTLFRSTEPYFDDHAKRSMSDEVAKVGFVGVELKKNTPSHVTLTAFKPR